VFGERITWGAGENALVFEQSLLALPLYWMRESHSGATAADAALALESDTPPAEFMGSLRRLIRSFLPAGYPHATLLAHASGLPLRSFQRALALGGLSFSDLVDQVRFEMATEMMAIPTSAHRHRSRARLLGGGEFYAPSALDRPGAQPVQADPRTCRYNFPHSASRLIYFFANVIASRANVERKDGWRSAAFVHSGSATATFRAVSVIGHTAAVGQPAADLRKPFGGYLDGWVTTTND
jgi:hypothetical protein